MKFTRVAATLAVSISCLLMASAQVRGEYDVVPPLTMGDNLDVFISVQFKSESVKVQELKARALEAIKEKGWAPIKRGTCAMNVEITAKGRFIIIFTEGQYMKTQQVIFDEDGKVESVHQGPTENPFSRKANP